MPFIRSLFYGLASLAYVLGYSTFNSYALFFYTDQLHAASDLIGRAWLLFGVWNTVNDLLCGWLSDRIGGRRRRVLPILVLSVPIGVSFALIWNPIGGVARLGPGALFWYFLLAASLYDVLQTAANISQGAAFPEITRRSANRSRVAAIRQGYGALGAALGVAVSPLLYDRFGWGVMGMVWGAIISGLWLLSLPGFAGENAPDEDAPAAGAGRQASLRLIFGSPEFRVFLVIQLTLRLAMALIQLALPFYAAHVLRLSSGQLSAVLGVLLGSAILAMPLWPWLLRRSRWLPDPRAGGIVAAFYLAAMLVPFLFARSFSTLLVLAALLGPAYAGVTVVLDLLYAQVADADFVRSGRSRAGLISGVIGTVLRLAPALAGLLLGELLAFSGYNPRLPAQPASAVEALRLLMTAIPGAALVLAGLALLAYPLHGARLAQLEADLQGCQLASPAGSGPE